MTEFLISSYGALWILVGVAYAALGILLWRSFGGKPRTPGSPQPLGYSPPPVLHVERPKPPPAPPNRFDHSLARCIYERK